MAIPKIREQIEARVKDTGDTMTGRLVQTLNGNPYYELNDGTNRWFFQAIKADNASYIGPTSAKALKIDVDGNATVKGNLTVDGSIIGSIQEAIKATQDGNGNVITSTYLPLSGGTITGTSGDTPLYLKSASTTTWLGFKKSDGTNLGFFGFSGSNIPAVYLDKTYKLLHDGNYNSYSPTLTGGGASGTWNISISGNAATATKATQDGNGANIASTYLKLSGGTMTGNVYFPNNKGIIQNQGATSNYTNIITWLQGGVSENTYDPQIGHHNTGDANGAIILLPYSTANSPWNGADGLYIGSKNLYYNGSSVLNTSNYNSYVPTKTGGGASGTWGISISGNAATATKATQDGNGATIASTYLKLSGGTMTGVISKAGGSSSWINGRDRALVRLSSYNAYSAITSMKTTNGAWEMGVYTNDNMWFTYTPDTNYNAGNNNGYTQIQISSAGALVVPVNTDYTTYKARNIAANTSALTSGSSSLSDGYIYVQYE